MILRSMVLSLCCVLAGAAYADAMDTDVLNANKFETAAFAGGCFWCMQTPFDKLEGVVSTTVGYTGGQKPNPAYEEVSAGGTGHAEAIRIIFDPERISYDILLDAFWRQIDPTDAGGQFVDRGKQYRSAIFYHNEVQRQQAEASKASLEASGRFDKPLVTEVVPASTFYAAEEYHQRYYEKNPIRYKFYRYGSGRDRYLEKIWGDEHGH